MGAAHLRFSGQSPAEQAAALEVIVRESELLMGVLTAARQLDLPDWLLVAGAVYNSVWNALTGRPALHGIKDADLFYFDPSDLGYGAEDRVIQAAAAQFAGLAVPVEVRNQARVHLWFPQHFGIDYPPLASSAEGVDRFTTRAHAVGLRLEPDDRLTIHAPFGLDDLFGFRLTPNRRLENGPTHRAKAAKALQNWPELRFDDW
jgi:hypothetical protein